MWCSSCASQWVACGVAASGWNSTMLSPRSPCTALPSNLWTGKRKVKFIPLNGLTISCETAYGGMPRWTSPITEVKIYSVTGLVPPDWFTLQTQIVNLLWLNDAIWWHRSGSPLAQVMACCLTAPIHNLKQCGLIINRVLWHSPKTNFSAQNINS